MEFSEESPFEGMTDEEIEELLQIFIEDIKEKIEELSELLIAIEKEPENREIIEQIYRIYHSLKGASASYGYQNISEIAHSLENFLTEVRDSKRKVNSELVDLLLDSLDIFKEVIIKIEAGQNPEDCIKNIKWKIEAFNGLKTGLETASELPGKKKDKKSKPEKLFEEDDSIKIKAKKIDDLINLVSELVSEKSFRKENFNHLLQLRSSLNRILTLCESLEEYAGNYFTEHSGLGENILEFKKALINHNQIFSSFNENTQNLYERQDMLADSIQSEVLKTRMVSVSSLFNHTERVIRDLSRKMGKQTEVVKEGVSSALDKKILEKLKDPFLHLVRNSIDHGMESPEERKRAGKPEKGKIKLSAIPKGNEILMIVEDDGKGIDVNAIEEIAVKKKISTEDAVQKLSYEEKLNLIFQPGFSTKKESTEISGRGVGLDVVKENLQSIHGIVKVETEKGAWTRFILKIPASLGITQVLLFTIGDFVFALPGSAVEEIMRIKLPPIPEEKSKFIVREGLKIPIIYPGVFFGIRRKEHNNRKHQYVIFGSGEQKVALEVDSFRDYTNIVSKNLGSLFRNYDMISGASLLPEGGLAFIFEPSSLLEHCKSLFSQNRSKKAIIMKMPKSTEKKKTEKKSDREKIQVLILEAGNKAYCIELKDVDRVEDTRDIPEVSNLVVSMQISKENTDVLDLRRISEPSIPGQEFEFILLYSNGKKKKGIIADQVREIHNIDRDSLAEINDDRMKDFPEIYELIERE